MRLLQRMSKCLLKARIGAIVTPSTRKGAPNMYLLEDVRLSIIAMRCSQIRLAANVVPEAAVVMHADVVS